MKTNTTKQTAANNPTLAKIKKQFNTCIFKEASRLLNEYGLDVTKSYIGMFFNEGCRDAELARIFE
jgi:hypothetical protein